ncbi:broad-specificity cellobiase [Faunimonas pinastri]|uniref:beta-glucosidase n=1 Tax=Faunimonas pinastri TaxID=1855383 RepID=A0A1H9ADU8_9HYPH|nr:family 1 glycosylhydrolase [Faunimonas pinastri]SEP74942.1 broad-specificity cellobiase [Faunimonas pinastri]
MLRSSILSVAAAFATLLISPSARAETPFLWGTSTAAYQVEGGWQADGKGLSNWDVYTNQVKVVQSVSGRPETGNVADDFYDRPRYLGDIQLMKKLGTNAFRFSIAWSRIFPHGTGTPDEAGLKHYSQFIDDLRANGIEPVVTIYHWDMPQALADKGGWANPDSVRWYALYADTLFREFGSRVKTFITVNEPFVDLFMIQPAVQSVVKRDPSVGLLTTRNYSRQAIAAHHILLASATAIRDYHAQKLDGRVGITLNFTPTIPEQGDDPADRKAAAMEDEAQNRWFLDAIYKGRYPPDVLQAYQAANPEFQPSAADMKLISDNPPDFLGANYYSPAYVRADPNAALGANWLSTNPDKVPSFNGPVRPEYLTELLLRFRDQYGNPPVLVTENGAGFGERDEQVAGDIVRDPLRADYIRRHVEAMLKARQEGANVQGYFLWSLLDNFEWTAGYGKRFGIVRVDFDTQKRTLKESFFGYRKLIADHPDGR